MKKVKEKQAEKKTAKKVKKIEKTKEAEKRSVETGTEEKPVPADFAQVRKNIATLVRGSAEEIATAFIAGAKAGQLAPAKYLFEAVGLYPATEETLEKAEDPLAYTLLKRMGLANEAVIGDEDEASVSLGIAANPRHEPADSAECGVECDGGRNVYGSDSDCQR
jgi:hypothetical protein